MQGCIGGLASANTDSEPRGNYGALDKAMMQGRQFPRPEAGQMPLNYLS